MLKLLYQDARRYSGVHIVWRALLSFDFYMVAIYRLSHWMYRRHLYVPAKVCWFTIRVIFACDIDPERLLDQVLSSFMLSGLS